MNFNVGTSTHPLEIDYAMVYYEAGVKFFQAYLSTFYSSTFLLLHKAYLAHSQTLVSVLLVLACF
jgi:hypothetical protein